MVVAVLSDCSVVRLACKVLDLICCSRVPNGRNYVLLDWRFSDFQFIIACPCNFQLLQSF